MTWPHGDPDAVVRVVLAQPAFRAPAGGNARETASLWQLAWQWFVDHVLAPLFAPIARAAAASHAAGTLAGFALVGLALLGLAFVAFRLVRTFVAARSAEARNSGAGDARLAAARDSAAWRRAAHQAAERCEYGPAIAALFAAALAVLDEAALVAFDAARTPNEYGRLVRGARASAAPPFDELAEQFVRAAYARAAPARAEYDAAERAYATFVPAVAA